MAWYDIILYTYKQSLFFLLSSSSHGKDIAKASTRKIGRRKTKEVGKRKIGATFEMHAP